MSDEEWEQMPINSSLNNTSKSSALSTMDFSWRGWLCIVCVESSLLLWLSSQMFNLDDKSKNYSGMDELDAIASIVLPIVMVILRLNLNQNSVLPFLVHIGSFALTGIAIIFAVHICGFFFAMSTSVALALTTSIAACMGCCAHSRRRKESALTELVTFTMMSTVCAILAVGLLTLADMEKDTKSYGPIRVKRNQTLVVVVSILLCHHVFFSAHRVRQMVAGRRRVLSGVATVAVVLLDVTGMLYIEYIMKIFVGAVRCRNVRQTKYFPRVRGNLRADASLYDEDDEEEEDEQRDREGNNTDLEDAISQFDKDNRYNSENENENESEDEDEESEDEENDVENDVERDVERDVEKGKRSRKKKNKTKQQLATKNDSVEDDSDSNNDEEEKQKTKKKKRKKNSKNKTNKKNSEKIAFKNEDKDDGDVAVYLDMNDDLLSQRSSALIRSHDTSTLWTFLDVDAAEKESASLMDERMYVCLYCHYSLCSFPSIQKSNSIPQQQKMNLNHYRSFVRDVCKRIKRKHDAVKAGKVDQMYGQLCQQKGCMDYVTFKQSLKQIYSQMKVQDSETFLSLYLLPLCDSLGKDKAASNVRSMKIRSMLGPYTRSNDIKNELLACEKFIYCLFTSYTRISMKSGSVTKKVSNTTKSALKFAQVLLMFQDFGLTPHEFSVTTLERNYRASLIDSKIKMMDESSFHYVLLSLGSESIVSTKNNNQKLDSGIMMRGLKYILREFDTCKPGREVFSQRFKTVLPKMKKISKSRR